MARCERQLVSPTQKTTVSQKVKAWSSIRRLTSALMLPPQWARAMNVQPISISRFSASWPSLRLEPMTVWLFRSTKETPRPISARLLRAQRPVVAAWMG